MSDRNPAARERVGDQVWWRRWRGRCFAIVRRPFQRDDWLTNLWLVVISGLTLWTAVVALGASHDANRASHDAKQASADAQRASHDAERAARKANENVAAIQQSRISLTGDNCRAQNHRHDKTIRRLNLLVQHIKDPAERARAEAGISGTIGLIDALVPKVDCAKLIRQRVSIPKRP